MKEHAHDWEEIRGSASFHGKTMIIDGKKTLVGGCGKKESYNARCKTCKKEKSITIQCCNFTYSPHA